MNNKGDLSFILHEAIKMFLSNLRTIFLLSIILLGTTFVFYCQKNPLDIRDDFEDTFEMKINLDLGFTIVNGEIRDAKTKKMIAQPVDIQLIHDMQDSTMFLSLNGHYISSYKAKDGLMQFAISKKYKPTVQRPFSMYLFVTSKGYLSSGRFIQLNDTVPEVITLYMAQAPYDTGSINVEGIYSFSSGIVDTISSVSKKTDRVIDIVIDDSLHQNYFSIRIPKECQFLDAAGNALVGSVSAQVVQFDPSVLDIIDALPGSVTGLVMDKAQKESFGFFFTAGFCAINIFVNTIEASQFSLPLKIGMDILDTIFNPLTGKQSIENEIIDIWSYDISHGYWKWEKSGVLMRNSMSDNLSVSFNTNHLSYWNLGWHMSATCDPVLQMNGAPEGIPLDIRYDVLTFDSSYLHYNRASYRKEYTGFFGRELQLDNVPVNFGIGFWVYYDSTLIGEKIVDIDETWIDSLSPPIPINLNWALIDSTPQTVTIPFAIEITCDNEIVLPTVTVLYRMLGDTTGNNSEPPWSSFEIVNGIKEVTFVVGETYEFAVVDSKGDYHRAFKTITSNLQAIDAIRDEGMKRLTEEYVDEVCFELTGS